MSETKELREEMRKRIENWGDWCYINPDKLLQIPQQPIFRMYVAPRGDKRLPSKPINSTDAEIANAAILHIRIKECPFDEVPAGFFSLYEIIALRWAHKVKPPELAEIYKVTRRTVQRRLNRAIDEFTEEYLNIIRDIRKINKKNSEKG